MKPGEQGRGVRFLSVACFALFAILSAGCGLLHRSPEETTRRFMEGWRAGDETAMRAMMTRQAREKMDRPLQLQADRSLQFGIGKAAVQTDFSQTPVTIRDDGREQQVTLKMRQDEGEWCVYAIEFPVTPNGTPITLDLEHPDAFYGDAFRGLGEGIGAMFKGMGEGAAAAFKGLAEGLQKLNSTPAGHP